ncbi:hypothetical protein F2Q69_00048452 [Brassica cretica]|uniref:Uncharacterized protein n=1 Tax=Brassica cretica TaxID=69181 RepID=A0A8S9PP79_BRACR|nr:hypothetical protein F2Q69_00048452 [Brassica cretica]
MSFGGSHWCRPMSMDAHRSTDQDEDLSTDYSRHRSTSSAESTAECTAVRIMTHEEFAEKHPHPPSPFYVKIDRLHEPAIDRQRETNTDRPPSPPIDRQTPLTHRVRLPSIDSNRINALRSPPEPLANPPEPTTNPSDTTPEPMQVDKATEGRVLRKRKEKTPKNLRREANEKEMDGFTKRVLRIPVEKQFDEVYYTHRLWMFFRETKETEEDIRRMFHHIRERMKLWITLKKKSDHGKFAIPCLVKGIEFPHALCDTGASVKTEYSESIDTHTITSIDSNESPTTDERYPTSLDGMQPVDHSTSLDQCYPDFSFQQPNKNRRDDYSMSSWADSGFHESFAVETVIISANEDPTEEYDEDYWKERATEIALQDERYSTLTFNNTPTPSMDNIYSASVDSHPHPAKQLSASIDTTPGTSIDIKAAALEKKKRNIPLSNRDQDGHARAMDGRILQVSREDIADIIQLANGVDNLFTQQHSIPDNNPTVPDEFLKATTTGIGSHQPCKPAGQASIDEFASTSLDRVTPSSIDKAPLPSIDRLYECGHARSATGDMILVTKDDIRKILERASLFGEGHICLPEHATTFTPTTLASDIYTKDEINEMVTGICGTQEKLGDELKTLHNLEKEATTSTSIDANKGTSIDVKPQTSQTLAKLESLAEKKDEWEIAYINTRINDIYNPLNNNVTNVQKDIGKLNDQHDFQEEGSTSIDRFRMTSLDGKKPTEHLPYTAEEVDQITSKLYKAMDTLEDRLEKRQLASQHQISASTDGVRSKWIDSATPATIDRHLVASIHTTSIPDDVQLIPNHMESMQEQLNELSEYAYSKISCYQFSIEDILERLQNISNALEMQMAHIGDTVKRQEALAREVGFEKAKHHVNVILDDDFWQLVKHEKLGKEDFEDEDRSTDYSRHRSTSSAESTAEYSAVRIMTHEEFAEKHPHPPSHFYVKIDRPHEPAINQQRETDMNRPLTSHRSTDTSHPPSAITIN